MTIEVTRTFDLLAYLQDGYSRVDALGGLRGEEWFTYSTAEYKAASEDFALGMHALGLKKGDAVATITNNRPEWNFADMGLAMMGLVHVPIYPTLSKEEYAYILNHAEVKLVLVGDKKIFQTISSVAPEVAGLQEIYAFDEMASVKTLQDILQLGRSATLAMKEELQQRMMGVKEDDLATIIYTSGTTGKPKGVMLSHRNLVSNFKSHVKVHGLGKDCRAVSFLPLCHVYERSMNYHFQYAGMGVYYVPNLGSIMSAIQEVKPHIFNCVPRILERIYDGFVSKGNELTGVKKRLYFMAINAGKSFEHNQVLSPIQVVKRQFFDRLVYSKWRKALGGNTKFIVSGGAALQPKIARVFGVAGIPIMEGYGMTESSPVIAVSVPKRNEIKIGTVGPVLEGTELKIADDGEILTRGPHVMLGYYKEPGLTAEAIESDGWLHTGDIGMLVDGKYLKITDRKKEIFKLSGGKYIAPQAIENKLKESFFIEQAMVIGENEKHASALISPSFAYLRDWCLQNGVDIASCEELIANKKVIDVINQEVRAINAELAQHEQIKRIRLVPDEWSTQTGELSPTLKLKRKQVEQKYAHLIKEIY
ncbi:MAG: AMP-dependent synthetase/ligase [Mangrovibacterium sp.]